MASTAYLDIAVESLIYTYEVEILSDPVRVSELREGRIEADKVELEVYTDPDNDDLADQLLFWDNPASVGRVPTELGEDFSLPARIRWEPSGEAPTAANTSDYAITGRLERRGVSGRRMYPGDSTCVWTLDIEVVAQRLLEEALEQIDLRDPAVVEELQTEQLYHEVPTWVRPEGVDDGDTSQDVEISTMRWWDVRAVLDWCFGKAGIVASYELDGVFRLDVQYDLGDGVEQLRRDDIPVGMCQIEGWEPSGTDPQFAPDNTVLTDITAYDLWARLVDLHGWVVEATHVGFPGQQIRVEAQDATMPDITDARDGTLDTDASLSTMAWTQDGYDLYHETPRQSDFALAYINDPDGDAPYPEAAKYAAQTRRINNDLQAYNENILTVDFRLPRGRFGGDTTVSIAIGDYQEQLFLSDVLVTRDDEQDVYLAELYDDGGTWRRVIRRSPQDAAAGQSTVVGAIYVRERLPAHAIHVGSRRVIEGEADLVAWVTDTQSPFEARPGSYASIEKAQYAQHIFQGEDLPWVVERLEWDYTRDTAQLRMVWPHKQDLALINDPDAVDFAPPQVDQITAIKRKEETVNLQGQYLSVLYIINITIDIDLQSTWQLQGRVLDDTDSVILTPADLGFSIRWTERWEADDPNDPPQTPPPDPAVYLDADAAQVRILDQADNSTTAWSAEAGIVGEGTETIIRDGQ